MAEIVNLRRARKRRARARDAKVAEANRSRFGTPKAERERSKAEKAAEVRRHEGHRLDEDS
jgi:hypothetical protein